MNKKRSTSYKDFLLYDRQMWIVVPVISREKWKEMEEKKKKYHSYILDGLNQRRSMILPQPLKMTSSFLHVGELSDYIHRNRKISLNVGKKDLPIEMFEATEEERKRGTRVFGYLIKLKDPIGTYKKMENVKEFTDGGIYTIAFVDSNDEREFRKSSEVYEQVKNLDTLKGWDGKEYIYEYIQTLKMKSNALVGQSNTFKSNGLEIIKIFDSKNEHVAFFVRPY